MMVFVHWLTLTIVCGKIGVSKHECHSHVKSRTLFRASRSFKPKHDDKLRIQKMPFNLQEECQALQQDASNYQIPNEHDVQSMDQPSISDLLDGACSYILATTNVHPLP